jgi:prophage regulatory protein
MEKLLIRPKELAEALGIGRTKTYELLASGIIPSVRVGTSIRIPMKELTEWIESQQARPYGQRPATLAR